MEGSTKTIRFKENAQDSRTHIDYSAGETKTVLASVADKMIAAGVAEEPVESAEAVRQRLSEAERVVANLKAEVQAAEQKPEPSEVPTVRVPAPHGLEDLTVQQLKEKAKVEGVDVSGLNAKADLVAAFEKQGGKA